MLVSLGAPFLVQEEKWKIVFTSDSHHSEGKRVLASYKASMFLFVKKTSAI